MEPLSPHASSESLETPKTIDVIESNPERVVQRTDYFLASNERRNRFQHLMEGILDNYRRAESRLISTERHGVSTEKSRAESQEILRAVAAAAERNAAVELHYERRQEVKDEPTMTPPAIPHTQIQGTTNDTTTAKTGSSKPIASVTSDRYKIEDMGRPQLLYKQAMIRGFLLAMAVLASVGAAFLIW